MTSYNAITTAKIADISGNATANTWTSTGNWTWTSSINHGNGGYTVKTDGITTTLFFPGIVAKILIIKIITIYLQNYLTQVTINYNI
jgi:hypothetical protein